MSKEKSDFKFWKRISEYIKDNKYTYIDSYNYNDVVSQVALEVYGTLPDDTIDSPYNYFKKRKEIKKAFICEVLEDILFNDNFEPTFHLINVIQNKEIIEEALNTISIQLTHKDYKFSPDNDYSKIIDDFKNQVEDKSKNHQNEFSTLKKINKKQNENSYKDKKLNVHMIHNNLYDELKRLELAVWRDAYSNNLYFRAKPYDEKQKTDKTKLADYLSQLFNKSIDIYSDTSDTRYQKSDFLIVSLLPMVKMDIYYPSSRLEFIPIQNNMYYRNTFKYTKFLDNSFNRNNTNRFSSNRKNTIIKFIEELLTDKIQYEFIINWLAYFFKHKRRSREALVLIGDNATTEILVNNIIKPIFAFKESDFCTINNNTLKNIDDLSLQNKIFYHIEDISGTPTNCIKASKIVKNLLKPAPTYKESIECEMIRFYGQLIITADKNDPYPYLKDSYSKCEVFKVKNLSNILKSFQLDTLSLEENIHYDLGDFCNMLSTQENKFLYNIQTIQKKMLQQNQFEKIKQQDISISDIRQFIYKIKNHQNNKTYFDSIKIDSELYDELIHNFEENMIARPILYKYFNMIHQEEIFTNNEELLKILRDEDDFFEQNIDKNKQYKKKLQDILINIKTRKTITTTHIKRLVFITNYLKNKHHFYLYKNNYDYKLYLYRKSLAIHSLAHCFSVISSKQTFVFSYYN